MGDRRVGDHRPAGRGAPAPFVAVLVLLAAGSAAAVAWRAGLLTGAEEAAPPPAESPRAPAGSPPAPAPPSPTPAPGTPEGEGEPREPRGPEPINRGVEGLTTFRGNASRTYYGEGPVPARPQVLWRYPASGGLCGRSSEGAETRLWCGTGWTGQPNVVEVDGRIEVRFGAFDYAVHVVDGRTGRPLKEPFRTGDIIKGTVTSDPDGFPLLYTGSRDNEFRILATDRGRSLVQLWSLPADSAPRPLWNNDWDGSALVVDDHLLVGGENSWFYVVKLNRRLDGKGLVTVDPEIRALVPGFDDELFRDLGDFEVSIENSVAFRDGVVYFANSGGLVQGWDISAVLAGVAREPRRVFRFWTGDDTDASVVIDDEGFLYVASELERFNARGREVGQLMKLDPREPEEPLLWSLPVPGEGGAGGIWATPALHGRFLIVPTNTGRVLGVDRRDGRIRWEFRLPGPTWSSPAIVDDVMIVGDCAGVLHAYDVARPWRRPRELWSVELGGCIESTPAVWRGMVYVGTRAGAVFGIGDPI